MALAGAEFQPRRTRKAAINPLVNHYVSGDGKRFILCCLDPQKDWANLCRAARRPELIDDERFRTTAERRANSSALIAIFDAVFAAADMQEWAGRFHEQGVIWGRVPSTEEVAHDPQMRANGIFVEFDHPRFGRMHTINSPMKIEGCPKAEPRAAPAVGQHTVEVLRELGYDERSISEMLGSGAAMAASASSVAGA